MLRLGLLSTARINRNTLRAAAATDAVEVVAVGSRDPERAAAYAVEHGIPRAHGSYEALLADEGVDAVYVSLPNGMHHEWTMRALEAGKHVLCEKPFSRHPEEVEQAFDLAGRNRLVVTEAFMYRHHPQTSIVRALVRDGRVGQPRLVRSSFAFSLDDPDDVRLAPGLEGGALMDVGCYCVSGSRLVGGEPERVLGEQVVGASGVDTSFVGTMRFPDGLVAQLECSFEVPRRQVLEVTGDEGSLVVHAPWRVDWGGAVELRRAGSVEHIAVPEADSYRLQLESFADAATGRAPPLLGRDDALGQARSISALYRAAAEGRSVEL